MDAIGAVMMRLTVSISMSAITVPLNGPSTITSKFSTLVQGAVIKKRRGFPATPNVSLHRFYPSRLRKIILPYLQQVNEMEEQEVAAINEELPFAHQP